MTEMSKESGGLKMTKMQNVENAVRDLVAYAVRCELIVEEERTFAANSIWDVLKLEPSFDFSAEGGEEKPL